jgi:hypothetical protein
MRRQRNTQLAAGGSGRGIPIGMVMAGSRAIGLGVGTDAVVRKREENDEAATPASSFLWGT